jgi:hypothetical protein
VRRAALTLLLLVLALAVLAGCGGGERSGGLREGVVSTGDAVLDVYAALAPAACRDRLDDLDRRFVAAATRRNAAWNDPDASDEDYRETEDAAVAVEQELDGVTAGCLAGELAEWDEVVAPLEAVATTAAGLIARSSVQCDSPLVWERSDRPPDEADGAVLGYLERANGQIHLSPATCLHLAHVVAEPGLLQCVAVDSDDEWACPPTATYAADALGTLAHEAQHVSGEQDEARTECYALQTVDDLAVRLGVAEPAAEPIGAYLLRVVGRPDEYVTGDCRRDGPLDIEPETPAFP